jgi:lysophospholipase L1-like esterase
LLRPTHTNGVADEPNTAPTNVPVPSPTPPGLRYLALGDSYTIGEKVAEGERFPNQLVKRLRARGVEIRSPQIVAHTGWTTADLAAAIRRPAPEGTFDLVTLLIGVNNQYRGMDLEQYQQEFTALVEKSVEFAGGESGRVIVISIPDWGVMPYARNFDRALITQQIDAFNQVNRKIAARLSVRYVNITPISRKAQDDAGMATSDGLHPSARQYQLWVEAILPETLGALGQ